MHKPQKKKQGQKTKGVAIAFQYFVADSTCSLLLHGVNRSGFYGLGFLSSPQTAIKSIRTGLFKRKKNQGVSDLSFSKTYSIFCLKV